MTAKESMTRLLSYARNDARFSTPHHSESQRAEAKTELTSAELVQNFELFDAATCAAITQQVHKLRAHWVHRHPTAPFYTLGAAAYLDGDKLGAKHYQNEIVRTRELMAANFGQLYETLLQVLRSALGAECGYHPNYGLPGFHIYQAHPLFEQRMGTVHVDGQFADTGGYGLTEVDLHRQYSMTLALRLPQSGGGLKVWPINGINLSGADSTRLAAVSQSKPKAVHHGYKVGSMALHSGALIHQIAPMKQLQPGDERLTLQAHTVWADGRWLVYW